MTPSMMIGFAIVGVFALLLIWLICAATRDARTWDNWQDGGDDLD
jgi:hypothetical protein